MLQALLILTVVFLALVFPIDEDLVATDPSALIIRNVAASHTNNLFVSNDEGSAVPSSELTQGSGEILISDQYLCVRQSKVTITGINVLDNTKFCTNYPRGIIEFISVCQCD